MAKNTFKGGIHPYEGKELTENMPIQKIPASDEVVFSLSSHIGAPSIPVVNAKEEVKVGQLIATAGGFVGEEIHSSVSGVVTKIERRLDTSGEYKDCIVIKNDGLYSTDYVEHTNDYTTLSKEEIIEKIRNAGVIGLGGAGFPTHVKYTLKDYGSIDRIIINGAECEPYLTSDYRMMLERGKELVEGLKVILQLFPKAKGIIAIEDNKPEAISHIQKLTENENKIEVIPLKTKYPQGGERPIIYATTKRKIRAGMLPSAVGCIVDNVATTIAVYDAVVRDYPLISTVMTLTGDVNEPCNIEAPVGTSFKNILEVCKGFKGEPEKVICGGPMMGASLINMDVFANKTSSSILAYTKDQANVKETPCIHCGKCLEVCPCHIVPQMMYDAFKKHNTELFEKVGGMECYECGSCSFICPAKKPLTQSFKIIKKQVMTKKKEGAK